jgi:hypothetical protein
MRQSRKPKCPHCRQLFRPDPRNVTRQKDCSQPECRKASKAASQKKWLEKPANHDYFQGTDNTCRVQQWRKCHPGYWRNKHGQSEPLQDSFSPNSVKKQDFTRQLSSHALQDLLSAQHLVFLGLLAQLTGSPLQDDIVTIGRRLQQLGQDILNQPFCCKGGQHDNRQSPHLSTPDPQGSRTIQLGGSPSGP